MLYAMIILFVLFVGLFYLLGTAIKKFDEKIKKLEKDAKRFEDRVNFVFNKNDETFYNLDFAQDYYIDFVKCLHGRLKRVEKKCRYERKG